MVHTTSRRRGLRRSPSMPAVALAAALLAASACGRGSQHQAADGAQASARAAAQEPSMSQTVYDFAARRLNGEEEPLSQYRGQVLLIVNTASKCGLTPQYAGLQKLYDEYGERGLTILGFPCNQFANQEPGTAEEIASFCTVNYGVTFPMFARIDVNGEGAHPLYQYLRGVLPGEGETSDIEWNFGKFLVDSQGRPVQRYAPKTPPEELRSDIEALLAGR